MQRLCLAQLAWDIQGSKNHTEERNFCTKQTLHWFLGKNKQLSFIQVVFILILNLPYYICMCYLRSPLFMEKTFASSNDFVLRKNAWASCPLLIDERTLAGLRSPLSCSALSTSCLRFVTTRLVVLAWCVCELPRSVIPSDQKRHHCCCTIWIVFLWFNTCPRLGLEFDYNCDY